MRRTWSHEQQMSTCQHERCPWWEGRLDKRLHQVFPHQADMLFGGCSCLLFGDFDQFLSVMNLPLYTTVSCSALSDLGSTAYQLFDHAIVLKQVMHQGKTQLKFFFIKSSFVSEMLT